MAVRQDASTGKLIDDGKAIDAKVNKDVLQVNVYSPFRTYFAGEAKSVSARNKAGDFDVLPQHHNFISLLDSCELVIPTDENGIVRIKITGGLMHIKDNFVSVLLDV